MTQPGAAPQGSDILLNPKDAVAQYVAGGLTTAVGMPNVYQLRALFAQTAAARFAWAVEVAKEFVAQYVPVPLPEGEQVNTYTLDDLGSPPDAPLTAEAFAYLAAVSQNKFIGIWRWTRQPSPDIAPIGPQIVDVIPPRIVGDNGMAANPAQVKVETHEGFFVHAGETIHEALMTALKWIEDVGKHL